MNRLRLWVSGDAKFMTGHVVAKILNHPFLNSNSYFKKICLNLKTQELKVSFDLKKGTSTVIKIATNTSCTFETVLTEYNKVYNYKSTLPVLGDQAPPDMTIRSSSEYGVLQLAGLARPIVQHAMGVRAFPFCRLAELVPVPSSSRSSLIYRKK